MSKLLRKFGEAFIPDRIRPKLHKYLLRAGVQVIPYEIFGGAFWLTALLTAAVFIPLVYPYLKLHYYGIQYFFGVFLSWLFLQLFLVLVFMSGFWLRYDLKIYRRQKEIEAQLDEFLQYVSENLRAGMSFDQALWAAARPQFGALSEEIKVAAKRAMTGQSVEESLNEVAVRYESPAVSRALRVISEGAKSGSELADIIDHVVEGLRSTKKLREQIAGAALTFVIFIGAIVMVVAPIIFSLSRQVLNIVGIFASQISQALKGSPTALPFTVQELAISVKDYDTFAYLSLGVTSLFAAMIISMIQRGDIRGGLKYIPVFGVISLLLYYTASTVIAGVMKNLLVLG